MGTLSLLLLLLLLLCGGETKRQQKKRSDNWEEKVPRNIPLLSLLWPRGFQATNRVGLRILWKSEQLPKQKRAILQLTFQSYVYFYYMYSLVHYCVHPMHDYSSFGTRLAHSSPRQSRIFILHFLCLVATTSLTRSSSLVPSWPTPRFKDRNRRLWVVALFLCAPFLPFLCAPFL